MDYKQLREEFDKLNGVEQWNFALKYKDSITLELDNDDTYFFFDKDQEEINKQIEAIEDSNDIMDWPEPNLFQFNGYIGWADGTFDLLKAIGFKARSV